LPLEDRTGFSDVVFLPPAARGDVERAADAYEALLLIDGVFHHDLAPSPKECFRAAAAAHAFGAASMGALRAAECAAYGFRPLGAIANWYCNGSIDGDDEVALLVDPASQKALSVPVVNVRYVARLALRAGLLVAAEAARFIDDARDIFYMDRTWDDAISLLPPRARTSVAALARARGDLKRLDARFALRTVRRYLARTGVPA
jgi:hypothetical protein